MLTDERAEELVRKATAVVEACLALDATVGAPTIEALDWTEWAVTSFRAGLDDGIAAAQRLRREVVAAVAS